MIIEDAYLRAALADRPVFLRKLHDFVVRHRRGDLPAFVLQARAVGLAAELPVRTEPFRQLLAAGSGESQTWWEGFRQSSSSAAATFDGIELLSYDDGAAWATALHADGHLIAGMWLFDDRMGAEDPKRLVLPYFYAEAFADFAKIVGNIERVREQPTTFEMTATLWHVSSLHFGTRARHGNGVRLMKPIAQPALQWPIRSGCGDVELTDIARRMADDLLAAFGMMPS